MNEPHERCMKKKQRLDHLHDAYDSSFYSGLDIDLEFLNILVTASMLKPVTEPAKRIATFDITDLILRMNGIR